VARKALGRGLEALIPPEVQREVPIVPAARPVAPGEPGSSAVESPARPMNAEARGATPAARSDEARTSDIVHVPLARISRNPAQPRTQFDAATIRELADSIRERGVLQPVLLRPAGDGYQLVAGERRDMAAMEAGFNTVPAIVRPLTDRESLLIALIENVQRENLNPVDEARAYYRLAAEYGLPHEEIAKRVGKDRSTVSNIIRFNNLPVEALALMEEGKLSAGHGRALLSLASSKQQIELAKVAAKSEWSVRELESRIQRSTAPRVGKPRRAPHRAFSAEILALEDELMRIMGTRVRITRRRGGTGSLAIDYHNQEELERLIEMLRTLG